MKKQRKTRRKKSLSRDDYVELGLWLDIMPVHEVQNGWSARATHGLVPIADLAEIEALGKRNVLEEENERFYGAVREYIATAPAEQDAQELIDDYVAYLGSQSPFINTEIRFVLGKDAEPEFYRTEPARHVEFGDDVFPEHGFLTGTIIGFDYEYDSEWYGSIFDLEEHGDILEEVIRLRAFIELTDPDEIDRYGHYVYVLIDELEYSQIRSTVLQIENGSELFDHVLQTWQGAKKTQSFGLAMHHINQTLRNAMICARFDQSFCTQKLWTFEDGEGNEIGDFKPYWIENGREMVGRVIDIKLEGKEGDEYVELTIDMNADPFLRFDPDPVVKLRLEDIAAARIIAAPFMN